MKQKPREKKQSVKDLQKKRENKRGNIEKKKGF